MIRINEERQLVLTPKQKADGAEQSIVINLERAYLCPFCEYVIKGVFHTDRGPDRMVNLNTFMSGTEALIRPEYENTYLRLPSGTSFQVFEDRCHCGEGELHKRSQDASANRCRMVKFYFEPSLPRLFNRFLKDLGKTNLYGEYAANKYRSGQTEWLNGVREALGEDMEKKQLFLAHHPYGRFIPDLMGQGPDGYLVMYRYEHRLIQEYYRSIIEKTNERIYRHQDQAV